MAVETTYAHTHTRTRTHVNINEKEREGKREREREREGHAWQGEGGVVLKYCSDVFLSRLLLCFYGRLEQ